MQYVTASLNIKDVDQDISLRVIDVSMPGRKGDGKMLSFTLKKEPRSPVNVFLYDGVLYMVDQQEGLYYECIAIDFIRIK